MRKLTALFVASSLAVGAVNLAHAADETKAAPGAKSDMMHHKGMHAGRQDMMFKNLNLTDAQKQQMKSIMKEQREKMTPPSVDERREMHNIIASEKFDSDKAQAQVDKMAESGKVKMLSHLQVQNKIYNILTPEQKKQFNNNFEKSLTERRMHKAAMGK